jgi:hypothetical protein
MNIKHSIYPYLLGAIGSGLLVLFWVLGNFGIIDIGHNEGFFWNFFILISSFIFAIMIYFVFKRPKIIIFKGEQILLRSIALLPQKIIFPKEAILSAEPIKLLFDAEEQAIRLHLNEKDERIKNIRDGFKSREWFGFKDNFFDCMIWGSEKKTEELADLINNNLKNG